MNTEHIASHPPGVVVFLLGVLGALAPEIYRLYRLRGRLHRMTFSGSFFVISILYALMGGVIALILPAVTYYGAFYAGITWPVAVSAALHHRPRADGSVALANSKDVQFINEAGAAEQIQAPRRSLRQLLRDHAEGLF
jgi:hypothetical protein